MTIRTDQSVSKRRDRLANQPETFGHEPFEYDGVPICARCYTVDIRCFIDAFDNPRRVTVRRTVPWPCTSAIVLGLAPRQDPTA